MRARLVRWGVRLALIAGDEAVREQIGFDFLAADVGEHAPVDLDAGTEHLAAFLDHFLALDGVVDDVTILEWQVVFAHDGADTLAPAAGRFQIGDDLRFIHNN